MNDDKQLYNNQKLSIKDQENFGRKEIDSGNAKFMDSLVSVDKLYNNLESSLQGIDNLKPDTSIKVKGLGYLTEIDLGTMINTFTIDNDKDKGTIMALDAKGDLLTYSKDIDTGKKTIERRSIDKNQGDVEITRLKSFPFHMVNKLSGLLNIDSNTTIYVESLGTNRDDLKWKAADFASESIEDIQDYTYWGSRHFFCGKSGGLMQTGGKAINSQKFDSRMVVKILTHIKFQACVLDGPHNKLYALDSVSSGNNLYVFNLNNNLEFIKTINPIKRANHKNNYTNISCSADFGKEDVCCDQPDTDQDYKGNVRPCPYKYPICNNYVANEHYGQCLADDKFEILNYNYQVIKPSIPNIYLNNLVPIKKNNPNIINGSEVEFVFVGTTIGDTSGKVNLYSGKIVFGSKEGVFPEPNCKYLNLDVGVVRQCGQEVINDYGLKPTHTEAYTTWSEQGHNNPPINEYKLPFNNNNIKNKIKDAVEKLKSDFGFYKIIDFENIEIDDKTLQDQEFVNDQYIQEHGDGSNYKAGGIVEKTIFPAFESQNPTLSQCKDFCLDVEQCKGIVYGDETGDNQVNQCYWKIDNSKQDKAYGFTSYLKIFHPEKPNPLGGKINVRKNLDMCNKTISKELDCKVLRGAVLELTKLVDQNFSGIEYIKLKKEDNFSNKGDELYNMVTNSLITMKENEDKNKYLTNRFIDLNFSESTGDILVLLDGILLKYPLSNLYNLESKKGVPTFRNMVDIPIVKIKNSIQELLGEYTNAINIENILDDDLIKRRNTELLDQVRLVNKEMARLKPVKSENKKLEESLNDSNWGLTTKSMRLTLWIILAIISTIFIILHFLIPELVPTNILITYIALVAIIIVISRRYLSKDGIRNIETKISDILSNFTFTKLKKLLLFNYNN